MPKLTMYDISIDDYRPVTQADVDKLVEIASQYGAIRGFVLQAHEKLYGPQEEPRMWGTRSPAVRKRLNDALNFYIGAKVAPDQ